MLSRIQAENKSLLLWSCLIVSSILAVKFQLLNSLLLIVAFAGLGAHSVNQVLILLKRNWLNILVVVISTFFFLSLMLGKIPHASEFSRLKGLAIYVLAFAGSLVYYLLNNILVTVSYTHLTLPTTTPV